MRRGVKLVLVTLLATVALAAAPALAQPRPLLPPPVKPSKATFPMPADQFQERIDARIAKAREKLERVTAKMPEGRARQVRARFDSVVAVVNAQVAKAVADGTVTKAEAERVNDAFSSGH